MNLDQQRIAFEASMFAYYEDLKAKGWSGPGEGDFTPGALFWREPNGMYGVQQMNAAWSGWLQATQHAAGVLRARSAVYRATAKRKLMDEERRAAYRDAAFCTRLAVLVEGPTSPVGRAT